MKYLLATLVGCLCIVAQIRGSPEKDLIQGLLSEDYYEKRARPVKDAHTKITVNITFDYAQLIDVYEKEQILTSEIWLIQEWYDEYLTWDPEAHGGVNYTVVRADDIWLPDIYIQNSVKDTENKMLTFVPGDSGITIPVQHTGSVQRAPSFLLSSSCIIDIQYFPFDTQRCPIYVSTWSNVADMVDLQPSANGVSSDQKFINNEWEVKAVSVTRELTEYACCPGIHYAELVYTVFLRRKPLFYVVNIILPSIMLHILTTSTFLVPPDAGERISLGLTCFLAYSVFTLIVADKVPDSSTSTPLVTCYLTVCMTANLIAVLWSVYAVRAWLRPPKVRKPLGWVTRVTKKFAKWTFLDNPDRLCSCAAPEAPDASGDVELTPPRKNGAYEKCETADGSAQSSPSSTKVETSNGVCEWHLLFEVIDRFLFLFFLVLMVVALLVLVIIIPYANYAAEDDYIESLKERAKVDENYYVH